MAVNSQSLLWPVAWPQSLWRWRRDSADCPRSMAPQRSGQAGHTPPAPGVSGSGAVSFEANAALDCLWKDVRSAAFQSTCPSVLSGTLSIFPKRIICQPVFEYAYSRLQEISKFLYVRTITKTSTRGLLALLHIWNIALPVGYQSSQCGARVALAVFRNIVCRTIASKYPPANLACLLLRFNTPNPEMWSHVKGRPVANGWRVYALIFKIGHYAPATICIPFCKFIVVHSSCLTSCIRRFGSRVSRGFRRRFCMHLFDLS